MSAMHVEILKALITAAVAAWLGMFFILVGWAKFKKWKFGEVRRELALQQPAFGLIVSFCFTLISEKHGGMGWICVMMFSWYLIYALWVLDSSDFKHPRLRKAFAVPLFCLALCSVLWVFGFRVNVTPSLPQGLYRLDDSQSDSIAYGDLVSFCLPRENPYSELASDRGYLSPGPCSNGLQPLLKNVVGLPGGLVEVSEEGIAINGFLHPGTVRPERDSRERPMPPSLLESGLIPPGYALTLAVYQPDSFDGRHFGLVPLASLKKVRPIITFDPERNTNQ